jgi:hypothetical protein
LSTAALASDVTHVLLRNPTVADLVDLAVVRPFDDIVRLGHQRLDRQRIRMEPRGFEPLTSALQRRIMVQYSGLRGAPSAERHDCD